MSPHTEKDACERRSLLRKAVPATCPEGDRDKATPGLGAPTAGESSA